MLINLSFYNFIRYFKQHHHQEHITEATMTVPSTTQRAPTETTVLSKTLKPPKTIIPIITSTDSRPTENTNVITEDYLKKNVKGSRHFERYFEKMNADKIPSPTPTSQEDTKDYTTKKILKDTGITEESIDLSTLPYDIVTDDDVIIDNDTALTSSDESIISTTTLTHVTIVDIKKKETSKSIKESISDSTDGYYGSDKSEVDIVINNVITSTLSPQSNDLEGNVSKNSTEKDERLMISVGDIAFSTTNPLIDLEENTSATNENNYSENSQIEVTTKNITILTSPTQSDPEEDRDTETSTTKYYEESAVKRYNETLINEIVTTESFSSTTNYTPVMDEKFSTTKIKNVTKI